MHAALTVKLAKTSTGAKLILLACAVRMNTMLCACGVGSKLTCVYLSVLPTCDLSFGLSRVAHTYNMGLSLSWKAMSIALSDVPALLKPCTGRLQNNITFPGHFQVMWLSLSRNIEQCAGPLRGEVRDENVLAALHIRDPETRRALTHIMQHEWDELMGECLPQSQLAKAGTTWLTRRRSSPVPVSPSKRGHWGHSLRQETVLLCRGKGSVGRCPNDQHLALPQRLYVQQGKGELRIATAIVVDDC